MRKENNLLILAMDLSLNLPAFCVARVLNGEFEVIELSHVDNKKGKLSTAEKLDKIDKHIQNIIDVHGEFDVVVRERGFSRFPSTTQLLFRVVGVSDLAIYQGLEYAPVVEIPPTTIKSVVAGNSKANKYEVEAGVREMLQEHQKDIEFYSDDESDSVAVALTYALKKGLLN